MVALNSGTAQWHCPVALQSGTSRSSGTAKLLICVSRRGGRKFCIVSKYRVSHYLPNPGYRLSGWLADRCFVSQQLGALQTHSFSYTFLLVKDGPERRKSLEDHDIDGKIILNGSLM